MARDIMIVSMDVKAIKEDDQYYHVQGVLSTYGNIDLGGDRVIMGAFTDDIKERGSERPALWNHKMDQPVGVHVLSDSYRGLSVDCRMPKDDDFVKGRVMPQIKVGSVKGLSIGYEVINSKWNEMDKCRDLIKLKLYEGSFTSMPMNEQCQIFSLSKAINHLETEYKSMDNNYKSYLIELAEDFGLSVKDTSINMLDENTPWDKGKAIASIKRGTKSEDKPSAEYKNAFMYYDKDHEDDFTAYKLPYCYYDNGLKAVPRAIYGIVGAISGFRSDIPDEEKTRIKSIVNKYYKKLGKDEPFQKNNKIHVDKSTIMCYDDRDVSKIFDENIVLSKNAKEWITQGLTQRVNNVGDSETYLAAALKELNDTMNKI